MGKKDHFIFDGGKDGHLCVSGSTEGGACLVGHDGDHSNFGKKRSCNYRYQALEHAKSNPKIKKYLHSYKDVLDQIADKYPEGVRTSAYEANSSKKMIPAHYCLHIDTPKSGDWDVGGPDHDIKRKNFKGKNATIKSKHNFTQDTWPYWNNAHHLIPKGTLKALIVDEGAEVGGLMEKGLLKVKYNINHMCNMLLMPLDKEVGAILDMPRHIQLKECGEDSGVKANCTNHPVYNEMVKTMKKGLNKIIEEYRGVIEDATTEKCEEPDFELDKKKLEELSEELLAIILKGDGGRSLDSLAQLNNDGA